MLTPDTPISSLKGIGEARSAAFRAAGIDKASELLEYFPRGYQFRGEVIPSAEGVSGEVVSIIATIDSAPKDHVSSRGLRFFTVTASDESGVVEIVYFNSDWLKPRFASGRTFRFYGRITRTLYGVKMANPVTEAVYPGRALPYVVPVYPQQGKLTQNVIFSAAEQVLPLCDGMEDVLHPDIIKQYGLMHRGEAVKTLHRPSDRDALEKARRSLAFEELLIFRLALRRMKEKTVKAKAQSCSFAGSGIRRFFEALPYKLTNAQERAVKDILNDMCKDAPMMRLVQGDVGSGKTVTAAAAMYFAVKNGGQAAMMAPTEILAKQHYDTLSKMLAGFGITVELLLGSTKAKEKERIRASIADGSTNVVVGTHALLQGSVVFDNLLLAVTDEQHRFGVIQRATLVGKSREPLQAHTLVMSATPIPRTLSLILYGDLDVSVIDEMPPGRQPTATMAFGADGRDKAYKLIRDEIENGHQAFIICPLVEDGDDGGKKAAESYAQSLKGTPLDKISAQTVHGRLSSKEKQLRMDSFASGKAKILISTTVVEVGVDVPNATVMLIENAECFGLSQLHQLRGRVGRGKAKSYCLLISGNDGAKASERLKIMCATSNGFEIAEADLKQRGPGDFFGERQSGEISFMFAGTSDVKLIEETGALAGSIPDGYITYSMEAALDRFYDKNGGGKTFN